VLSPIGVEPVPVGQKVRHASEATERRRRTQAEHLCLAPLTRP
jgi:hypothetical protein